MWERKYDQIFTQISIFEIKVRRRSMRNKMREIKEEIVFSSHLTSHLPSQKIIMKKRVNDGVGFTINDDRMKIG